MISAFAPVSSTLFICLTGVTGARPCPVGRFSGAGASECEPCKSGRLAPEPGADVCLLADPGYFAAANGSSVQTPCDPGFYSGSAAKVCTPCPVGEYNDRGSGQRYCTRCIDAAPAYGPAFTTLGKGSNECDACIEGDFPEASRRFAKTAGVFQYLGDELLPNWMANSKQHAEMQKESLAETRVGVCVSAATVVSRCSCTYLCHRTNGVYEPPPSAEGEYVCAC